MTDHRSTEGKGPVVFNPEAIDALARFYESGSGNGLLVSSDMQIITAGALRALLAARSSGEPVVEPPADNLHLMLMAQSTNRLQEIWRLNEMIATLRAEIVELKKPIQILGLCKVHLHIGVFPHDTDNMVPPLPPTEVVCPWCVKKASQS